VQYFLGSEHVTYRCDCDCGGQCHDCDQCDSTRVRVLEAISGVGGRSKSSRVRGSSRFSRLTRRRPRVGEIVQTLPRGSQSHNSPFLVRCTYKMQCRAPGPLGRSSEVFWKPSFIWTYFSKCVGIIMQHPTLLRLPLPLSHIRVPNCSIGGE
jgi:hypothetical protein